jgi:hypothetical protein
MTSAPPLTPRTRVPGSNLEVADAGVDGLVKIARRGVETRARPVALAALAA